MKVTMHRVKHKDGYIDGSSIQTTKDKIKALTSLRDAELKLKLLSPEFNGLIESMELKLKPCKVGNIEFGKLDTYSLGYIAGYVIHETKKHVYTATMNEWTGEYHNIQKHKKEDVNTQDFHTGQGYRL